MAAARVIVTGRVQGVFFRRFVKDTADSLGLKGWVMNLKDYVEFLAEGPKDKIEKLIDATREGPRQSEVKDVKVEWVEETGELEDFSRRYVDGL